MNLLKNTALFTPVAFALICSTCSLAQEVDSNSKTVKQSPVGSWAWERKSGDESVLCVLTISEKGGKLEGKYKDNNRAIAIKDAKWENGSLTFSINPKPDDESRLINFKGKMADNSIKGTMSYMIDGSEKSTEWTAKPYDPYMAVLGKWNVNFETPDGQKLSYDFEVEKKGEGIGLEFLGDNDSIVSKVGFKNDVLVFDSKQTYEGQPISVEWDLSVQGDKISGVLFYSFSEGDGELNVTGSRIK